MRSRVRNVSLQTVPGNKEAILQSDGTLPPSPFQYSCVIVISKPGGVSILPSLGRRTHRGKYWKVGAQTSGIASKMGILREVTEKATPDGKKATDAPQMRSRETVQGLKSIL